MRLRSRHGPPRAARDRPVVIVSNRGPLSFDRRRPTAGSAPSRARAGWSPASRPLVDGTDAVWIAAALSDGDRAAAAADGVRRRRGLPTSGSLALDPDALPPGLRRGVQRDAVVPPPRPLRPAPPAPPRPPLRARRGRPTATVNRAFADVGRRRRARAAPPSSCRTTTWPCCPGSSATAGPTCAVVHFSHTPFAGRRASPCSRRTVATEVLEGMAAATACGFHTAPLGAPPSPPAARSSAWRRPAPSWRRSTPTRPACDASPAATRRRRIATSWTAGSAGDRCIVRVDRIELSKNLAARLPRIRAAARAAPGPARGGWCFAAFVLPVARRVSRSTSPTASRSAGLVDRINARWRHVRLDADPAGDRRRPRPRQWPGCDGPTCSSSIPCATGSTSSPWRAPLVNEREAVLVLSTEAGVHERARRARPRHPPLRHRRHGPGPRTGGGHGRRGTRRPLRRAGTDRRVPVTGRLAGRPPRRARRAGLSTSPRSASRAEHGPDRGQDSNWLSRSTTWPGPSTTMSAPAVSWGGASALATATLTVCDPRQGEVVEGGEGGQVTHVVAEEHDRLEAGGGVEHDGALADLHRRVQLDGHLAGPHLQPGSLRVALRPLLHHPGEGGVLAVVQGERGRLGLDEQPLGHLDPRARAPHRRRRRPTSPRWCASRCDRRRPTPGRTGPPGGPRHPAGGWPGSSPAGPTPRRP